ncbi:MAG TPA: PQQ-binding-like beta-propeller repeat protein [Halobacteriales archaeon]|nr:PQQ-binding-like beta-propeller repeat protein [Halobacteriales archaeon]
MKRRRVLGALATGTLGFSGCLGSSRRSPPEATPDGSPAPDDDAPAGGNPEHVTPTTQFQYDARNSGVADVAAPGAADLRWRTTLDPIDGGLSVADGRVVAATGGNLVALDADSGDVRWDVGVGHSVESPPALTADTAYVACWNGGPQRDRGVAAIDLADGSERWRAIADVDVTSAPTLAADSVYVGGSLHSGEVVAIDAVDGEERWRFEAGRYATTPAVDDGVVYVGGGESPVAYALDARDGSELWRTEVEDRVWGAPTVVEDAVYVGSRSGRVYALAPDDGHERWSVPVGDDVRASVAATDDGVFVASEGSIASLDLDGDERWSVQTRGYAFAPTVASDAVVVTDATAAVCLGADDGGLRWRHEARERQISDMVFTGVRSPPVVADGVAYVASHGGDVYALSDGS